MEGRDWGRAAGNVMEGHAEEEGTGTTMRTRGMAKYARGKKGNCEEGWGRWGGRKTNGRQLA